MNTLFDPIDDTASEFAEITARLLGLYEVWPSQTPSKVTPKELLAGIEQFFAIAIQVERDTAGDLSDKDVTQIREYALSMFVDRVTLMRQQNLKDFALKLNKIVLGVADWIMRNGGQIQSLEPVVDVLAVAANSTQDLSVLRDSQGSWDGCARPAVIPLEMIKNAIIRAARGRFFISSVALPPPAVTI